MADDDEEVGLRRRQHRLERLDRLAAGLGGVEGRPAAREDDAPSGSRRSPTRSGTPRSHSGCAKIAFRVSSPGT